MIRPCANGGAVDSMGVVPLCAAIRSPCCQRHGLERVDRPAHSRLGQVMKEETAETLFTASVRKVQARAGPAVRRWA